MARYKHAGSRRQFWASVVLASASLDIGVVAMYMCAHHIRHAIPVLCLAYLPAVILIWINARR